MSDITITRRADQPFSAFQYGYEAVRAAKDKATSSGNLAITLEGFDDRQSLAVSVLLLISYMLASGQKMGPKLPEIKAVSRDKGPNYLHAQYDGLGNVAIVRDEKSKKTVLSFPAHEQGSFPAYGMQHFMNHMGKQLAEEAPAMGLRDRPGIRYEAFLLAQREIAELAMAVWKPLVYAHGHAYEDAISSCLDGLEVEPGERYPAVLIKKEAMDDIRKAEAAVIRKNLEGPSRPPRG